MNRYTIYCTESQTRKALELGAPIDDTGNPDDMSSITFIYEYDDGEYCIVFRPTAEQMRGWLMDKLCAKTFQTKHYSLGDIEGYGYLIIGKDCVIELAPVLNGRWLLCSDREATLAAIDAALEYLESLKQ